MTSLLDTHVLVWWVNGGGPLTRAQSKTLASVTAGQPALVSDITLCEIAVLCQLGRLELTLPLRDWLERAVAPPLVRRVGISPAVASEVAALPPTFHGDPADRILVATALVYGAVLLTRDRRIVGSRLVRTI